MQVVICLCLIKTHQSLNINFTNSLIYILKTIVIGGVTFLLILTIEFRYRILEI